MIEGFLEFVLGNVIEVIIVLVGRFLIGYAHFPTLLEGAGQ